MKSKCQTFTVFGGVVVTKGKPEWPDMIEIALDKAAAVDLIHRLLSRLDDDGIYISLFGELKPMEEI